MSFAHILHQKMLGRYYAYLRTCTHTNTHTNVSNRRHLRAQIIPIIGDPLTLISLLMRQGRMAQFSNGLESL